MGFSPFNLFSGLNSAEATISGSKHNPSPWGKDFKLKYHTKGVPFEPGSVVIRWDSGLEQFWIDWNASYYGTLIDFALISIAVQATPPLPIWKTVKWSTMKVIGAPNSVNPLDGYPIQDMYESTFGKIPSGPWNVGFAVRPELGYSNYALMTKYNRQLITTTFP